jgi:hypothetical protein
MFTKSTIALAIIVSVTSGALAATKQQHGPASNVYNPGTTWQDPMPKTWDSYGLRWE